MLKNLPCSAEDVGLIPGQGTKISHGVEQLSPVPRLLSLSTKPLLNPMALAPISHN